MPHSRAHHLALTRVGNRARVSWAVAVLLAACLGPEATAGALRGPDAPASQTAGAPSWWVAVEPGRDGVVPGSAVADRAGPHRSDAPSATDRSVPRARWLWPLAPRPAVRARFRPPGTAYGPGHRGVDLAAVAGATVHAVAAGRVSFAGVIGGKATVAVTHPDGVRSTYEPVTARVATGDLVAVGQPIGLVAGAGSHCTATCLHLGAVRGSAYLDPLLLLGWWRVRLLPLDQPSRGPATAPR